MAKSTSRSANRRRPSGDSVATTACENCPLRENKHFRKFEAEEFAFVKQFKTGEMVVKAGSGILRQGHDSAHFFTILEGWALRSKALETGNRQVLNFAISGDFIGLQSVLFDGMDHTVEALTDMRLCVFSRQRIWEIYRNHPGLGYDLTWMVAREESIMAEHLANVGQRSAFERLAYIIIYLFDRARRCGLTQGRKLKLPITQQHLADTMGLSIVHTNKTLKKLKSSGLAEWRRNEFELLDEDRLRELALLDGDIAAQARPFI